jgi:hypothetical protein
LSGRSSSSSTSSTMRGSRARDQHHAGGIFDEGAYYSSGANGSSSRRSRGKLASDAEEGLLDGVPSLSGQSSLSKGVRRERGLLTSRLGIAGEA